MTQRSDDRTPLARAAELASAVVTICVEMVVPALLGYWADRRLGTTPLLVIVGGGLGLAIGLWSLIRLTNPMRQAGRRGPDDQRQPHDP